VRRRHDDLTAWQDDPVVQALTAAGTESELAGEAMALAAFRAAAAPRARRRYAGRLGVGGSALAVAIAFSGGVAAAYTAALPSPVQHALNVVGGWAGIPPAAPVHHSKHRSGGSRGTTQAGPAPTASASTSPPTSVVPPAPSTTPTVTHHHPATKSKPSVSTPPTGGSSAPVSPPPSPTATPTPTPTITAPVPGSITITVAATKVPIGGNATVIGHLATAGGQPIAGHRVWLIERLTGQGTAAEIASGLTGPDGSVDLTASGLTHSVRLRLLAGQGVRSAPVLVVVTPTVSASVALSGSSYDVAVATDGGNEGDQIVLERRTSTGWVGVTTTTLDGSGSASFAVPVPPKRTVRYRVVLPRTQAHGLAMTAFLAAPA
jgi:hypothetical protein